ncbi:DUF6600 domain-containing protein [Algoriphagus sp. A40]|uniref:DUF6600 domain-containing protein n=1 Tax=Algoriphagus sp. A40 TaxID=1945863 RepID=UPI0011155A5E|nr:DUF6600 domain-containing protein [Algoriphagus sp. A40]
MKMHFATRWFGSLALGVFLLSGMIAPQEAEAKNYRGVSFQFFYDELAPYGDWVKDARYGYIWLPAVRGDFHPYGTEGHWVMTEYGNTWVSYYDWGWAPFHYGRWYFDDYFQSWAWIPGYDWGPAWVNWRTGGGYYGWAPLGPGVSISVRVNIPAVHWVFVPNHRIHHHFAYRYHAPHKTKVKIYNNTTIINNTVVYNNHNYVGGPQRREVERVTRTTVPVYNIQASNAPGRATVSRNSVAMYKPEVQDSRGRTNEMRPSRVLDVQQAKTARSNRELNSTTPSRNSSPSVNSGGRSVESSPRNSQNPTVSGGTTAPSRSSNPSVSNGGQKPTVTPMPSENNSRGTTTAPSRSQNSGSRENAPARTYENRPSTSSDQRGSTPTTRSGSEVKKEESRTQQSAPSRGSVQQSRPAQAPVRTQSSEVKRSEPAKSGERVSQPSSSQNSRSSSQVKTSAPTQRDSPANTERTSSTNSSKESSRGRNN